MSLHIAALLLAASSAGDFKELNVIIAELESKRDWTEADRTRAKAVTELTLIFWGRCLRNAHLRLQRSTEAVETVATAILGSCLQEEHSYRRAAPISYRGKLNPIEREELAETAVSTARANTRETIISKLVTERLTPTPRR